MSKPAFAFALLAAVVIQGCGEGDDGAGGHGGGGGGTTAQAGNSGSAGSAAGTGGATAGTGGAIAGMAGATSGMGGGGAGVGAFMAVPPCNVASDYLGGVSTITFASGNSYSPACLKVSVGASVTFSGFFSTHPLSPSTMRGTLDDNPIVKTTNDGSPSFTFSTPGFFAYWCTYHGSDTTGSGMTGVVWVE